MNTDTEHARTIRARRTVELSLARPLGLLSTEDLGWIEPLVATVVALGGQPWRLALDAIEAGTWMPGAREVPARRLAAVVYALRRTLAGRAVNAALARKARSLVLGVPALTDDAREGRMLAAAAVLDVSTSALEQLLWADLPRERPIELPVPPPSPLDVAALANVGLVQRALRRAHAVELRIRGDASRVLRGASASGLLATASQRTSETVLEIVGPLALCHGTSVYGRALGNLVPLLGACADFTLTIRAEARGQAYELDVRSPALLPPPPAARPWRLVEQLARDLERRGLPVVRSPAAIVRGGALACPDLGVHAGERIIWIEIAGFWTPEYLARKIARYQAAGAGAVVLCVDATRACNDDDPPAGACVLRFERRVPAEALAQLLELGTITVG